MILIAWISSISLEQKTNLNHIKKVCGNKDSWDIVVPSEETKILEFNQYQKSDKTLFVIYEDVEYLIDKIHGHRLKDIKIIRKIHPKQSKWTYSIRFFNVYNIAIKKHRK